MVVNASSPSSSVGIEVQLRGVPLPSGCDHNCGSLVLALRAVLTRASRVSDLRPPTRIGALWRGPARLDDYREYFVSISFPASTIEEIIPTRRRLKDEVKCADECLGDGALKRRAILIATGVEHALRTSGLGGVGVVSVVADDGDSFAVDAKSGEMVSQVNGFAASSWTAEPINACEPASNLVRAHCRI